MLQRRWAALLLIAIAGVVLVTYRSPPPQDASYQHDRLLSVPLLREERPLNTTAGNEATNEYQSTSTTPSPSTTAGGCVNNTFPFLVRGGFIQTSRTNFTVLAVPSTNLQELNVNLSKCSATAFLTLTVVVAVAGTDASHRHLPDGPKTIIGVYWESWPKVPYHALFFPSGFVGQHALLTSFAQELLPYSTPSCSRATELPVVPDIHVVSAEGRISQQNAIIAEFYRLLFNSSSVVSSHVLPMQTSVWSHAPVVFMPAVAMARTFWSLPVVNSVTFARKQLDAKYGYPEIVPNSVFVEHRAFQHRPEFHQFRGFRPAVWKAVRLFAWKHKLALDVVNMRRLTFRQQWNKLHSKSYIIVSEGSFSVWLPFLRKDTVCLMVYDHYSHDGWLIPKVHLPLALLYPVTKRTVKMVFLSLSNQSVPSDEVLTAALLKEDTSPPQVRVVTVPYNATFEAHLSTVDAATLHVELV